LSSEIIAEAEQGQWSMTNTGEMVTFKANGREADGYLALPASGSGPGLVVIQEYWGLVPHIKSVTDRFAREGFVALAPDLFHGETTASADIAWKMLLALRVEEAEKDLRGAVQYLAQHKAVQSGKVGTVGFCMGGALSLFAASNANVAACVVFYGIHPSIVPDIPNLQAPVLGIYAEKDSFVSQDAVKKLDDELTRHGKRHEFHTYPGVDHAFFNDTGKNYNKAAAEDAWTRTIQFLRRELK
jgi:carboxymethylenebutenolidase